jgi:peptidoglycan/LPS O-acetylase OafA/YrhL
MNMSTSTDTSRDPSVRSGIGYHGGLDGIRALAIVAVLLYHGGVVWAAGGFLGVEAFFVLSGFLITSLLIAEWRRHATIALGAFWARRARRLLPALFCVVVVVGLYEALSSTAGSLPGLKGDGIATLFYYGNWHEIATQSNYFAATGPVSPLQHTWSLAIEEQFYILWPVSLLAAIWLMRRVLRRRRPTDARVLGTLLAVSVTLALASAVEAMMLFHGGAGVNRVYYGTDTRAVSLLTGASLAFALAILRGPDSAEQPASNSGVLGWCALLALSGVLVLMHYADGTSPWLYPFGMVGLDLSVAVIIAAVVLRPWSVAGRIFSVAPARRLGQISYGVYLWHFPLFLWLTFASTGVSGASLLGLRLSVTLLVATVSFVLIEQPVRRRKLPNWLTVALAPAALGTACAALFAAAAAAAPPVATPSLPPAPIQVKGHQLCHVRLTDTKQYGLSPMSPEVAAVTQPKWLVADDLPWDSHSLVTFHTCPPKRVMLIGDSLAFSLGLGQLIEEHNYGVELADAAILGCSFHTGGELSVSGTWESPPADCSGALSQWRRDERAFRPQAVIVELGYRDEFDWRVNGKVIHLGQPNFDHEVEAEIERYVQVLGAGKTPIMFLSVPYANPRPAPDGSPSPAGSPARHALINSMLRTVASRDPSQVRVLDIDKVVSPGNRYQRELHGKLCRFDGIHFAVYCSQVLAPDVLTAVRGLISTPAPTTTAPTTPARTMTAAPTPTASTRG